MGSMPARCTTSLTLLPISFGDQPFHRSGEAGRVGQQPAPTAPLRIPGAGHEDRMRNSLLGPLVAVLVAQRNGQPRPLRDSPWKPGLATLRTLDVSRSTRHGAVPNLPCPARSQRHDRAAVPARLDDPGNTGPARDSRYAGVGAVGVFLSRGGCPPDWLTASFAVGPLAGTRRGAWPPNAPRSTLAVAVVVFVLGDL